MSIHVEIPEPLAEEITQAAKAQAKSAHDFILEAVRHTLASSALRESPIGESDDDPLLGLLSHDLELADFIEESAMHAREVRPLRTVGD